MGELPLHAEESLRIAAPNVYDRMIQTFSKYHLHPFDAEGIVSRKETGLEITLRLAGSSTNLAQKQISFEQAQQPDEEITSFFETSAEECKNLLIKNYFKMIKL